jgi:hypothetical protein
MDPVLNSLPPEYEVIIWNNAERPFDAKLLGRHLAVMESARPVVYFQDDDCIFTEHEALRAAYEDGLLVANMPEAHGREYPHLSLLGWGSLLRKNLVWAALNRYLQCYPLDDEFLHLSCDIAVSVIIPSRRVDLGHVTRPFWRDADRCHQRPGYWEMKRRCYERAFGLRGA